MSSSRPKKYGVRHFILDVILIGIESLLKIVQRIFRRIR